MARRQVRPALTPEGREAQLIHMAYDYAEKQFIEGTASSQVTTHFLKLGSTREKLEQEKLRHENLLLSARRDSIESGQRIEAMYEEALNAMRSYSGEEVELEFEGDQYDDY